MISIFESVTDNLLQIVHAPLRQCPLSRRTFTFAAPAVKLLKQRATAGGGKAPSTFAAMAAHGWVSIARASGLADDGGGPVFAVFLADARALMSPPAPAPTPATASRCARRRWKGELAAGRTRTRTRGRPRPSGRRRRREARPLGDRARWHDKLRASRPGAR